MLEHIAQFTAWPILTGIFIGYIANRIMSRVEVNDDFVKRNFNRIHGEWLKTAKRTRPLPVCFHKSVKSHDEDEFLFVGCSHDGKTLGIVILAVIPSEKGKEYVMIDEDMYSDFLRDKLTPHFIKRYRERGMNGQECSSLHNGWQKRKSWQNCQMTLT